MCEGGVSVKQMELCVPCAEKMREGYTLRTVKIGVNQKVTCAGCGRRRYGAHYEVEKKEAKK